LKIFIWTVLILFFLELYKKIYCNKNFFKSINSSMFIHSSTSSVLENSPFIPLNFLSPSKHHHHHHNSILPLQPEHKTSIFHQHSRDSNANRKSTKTFFKIKINKPYWIIIFKCHNHNLVLLFLFFKMLSKTIYIVVVLEEIHYVWVVVRNMVWLDEFCCWYCKWVSPISLEEI